MPTAPRSRPLAPAASSAAEAVRSAVAASDWTAIEADI